jgi:shikimate dehydrogenase
MKHFAVIGHPIGHSLSPLMHNTAFKLLDLDCHYESLDIEPTALKQAVENFKEQTWGGINVTVPHKEAIIPLIDEVVPEARSIGAVNTVVNRNKMLVGYNTDIIGVERSLHPFREKIEGQLCTILGSGGAARSVTHALIRKFKVKAITFAALYPEQADALIKSIGVSSVKLNIMPYTDQALESAIKGRALIVNATTVGMYPNVLDSPISNKSWLSNQQIVFDVIYRPLKTRLLSEAQEIGAKTIDGLGMFIHQGAAAFQLWTGKEMPIEEIRRVLKEKLSADN